MYGTRQTHDAYFALTLLIALVVRGNVYFTELVAQSTDMLRANAMNGIICPEIM